MANLHAVLSWTECAAFGLLAAVAFSGWFRRRDRGQLMLALSVGGLAGLTLVANVVTAVGAGRSEWVVAVILVLFGTSGYAVVLLRDALEPMSRRALLGYLALTVAGVVLPLFDPLFGSLGKAHGAYSLFTVVVLIVGWIACVSTSMGRLWRASSPLPVIQRARVRALVEGYVGLVAIVMLAGLAAFLTTSSLALAVGTQIATLLLMPFLVAAFAPPRWLRWSWREREEQAFLMATHDLLLFTTQHGAVRERGLEWALRLTGAEAGFMMDYRNEVNHLRGMTQEEAAELAPRLMRAALEGDVLQRVAKGNRSRIALAVPLHSRFGTGLMVAISGPFTPIFGVDEVTRLTQYSVALAAAIDRVSYSSLIDLLSIVGASCASAATVDDACQLALETMCGDDTWVAGHSGYIDAAGVRTDRWLMPEDGRYEELQRRLEARTDEMAVREPEMIAELADSDLEWAPTAVAAGLHACMIIPIIADTGARGVLELFSPQPWAGDHSLVPLIGSTGRTIGRVVERVAAMQQLTEARATAEAASLAKSEYLSRMSHELRTPLTSILGFTELLQMSDQKPEDRQSLELVERASNHLLELVNDVLDIARIESGRDEIDVEPVRLSQLVDEAIALTEPSARGRGMTLANQIEDTRITAMADPQRLSQVVLNLLTNAIKYATPQTTITVTVSTTATDRVRLTVNDEGPGIAEGLVERLFEPFDRVGAERSRVEGTGLGLALARRLVESMGGTIGVITGAGQASHFWVELAVAEAGSTPSRGVTRDPAAAATHHDAPTLLYVEDNLATAAVIERVLTMRPHIRLMTAMQGTIAIELAREHHPALILLDLHLPDMSGDEVLRRLMAAEATSDVPVVVLTADTSRTLAARCTALGAVAIVTKPIRVAAFLQMLDDLLGRPEVEPDPAELTAERRSEGRAPVRSAPE